MIMFYYLPYNTCLKLILQIKVSSNYCFKYSYFDNGVAKTAFIQKHVIQIFSKTTKYIHSSKRYKAEHIFAREALILK